MRNKTEDVGGREDEEIAFNRKIVPFSLRIFTRSGVKTFLLLLLMIFSLFLVSCKKKEVPEKAKKAKNENEEIVEEKKIKSAEEVLAKNEFRRAVISYYRRHYNEAVLQLEKALSYTPSDYRVLKWLGKAYYHAGMEGAALDKWEIALEAGKGSLLLENQIEAVRERRLNPMKFRASERLSEMGTFHGFWEGEKVFSGPMSVLPNGDGSFWLLAYNSNEMIKMTVNGTIIHRVTGGLSGFDRPVDLIRLSNGNILVSESAGDCLTLMSESGKFISHIGKKGRGTGELLGPTYLAEDKTSGNIFVSDYGNKRITVFDKDGKGIFSFGNRVASDELSSLEGPTGLSILNGRLYVADDVLGGVYEFDLSGNFLRAVTKAGTFKKIESLKASPEEGVLLATDKNVIYTLDAASGACYEIARLGNAPVRAVCAAFDANSNLLISDIKNHEVIVMSRTGDLIGGLFVDIEMVNAKSFPYVKIAVNVENRSHRPIVGLRAENFLITERKKAVRSLKYLGCVNSSPLAKVVFLLDRNTNMREAAQKVQNAVREMATSFPEGIEASIICAGKNPERVYSGSLRELKDFNEAAIKSEYVDNVTFDLALRLSANELLASSGKTALILITDGSVSQSSFGKYTLSESTAFLNNNGIPCLSVVVNDSSLSEDLAYIVENTGGSSYYIYRNEGLSSLYDDISRIPRGVYMFEYLSSEKSGFGEKFLPVEVETYLLNRSGRDESGYFAPLE